MSIILIDKKSSLTKQIPTTSEFLNITLLKKFASVEFNCHPSELKLFHMAIDIQYRQGQIVKQGEKINYLIQPRNDLTSMSQTRKKGIVCPQELQKIIQNSKIIVIKSANQENIQKSKQHSLWATTFSNQERLKYFFNHYPHVILMFATNRSYQIKGLARMQSEPEKITDKTVWAGVSNIRLGGNFKIKWLRKKPLSLVTVEKSLGSNFKEAIIKSCDGQQLDPSSCKKLAHFFEVPSEPYYQIEEDAQTKSKEINKPQLSQQDLIILSGIRDIKIPPLPQLNPIKNDALSLNSEHKKDNSSSSSEQSSSQSIRKNKKIKKNKSKSKSKKSKKHRKKQKDHKKQKKSLSSSENLSSDSSDRSLESEERRKKNKKDKRHKKHKKHKKHRS